MIPTRHIKAWEKFNEQLNAFRAETGDDYAMLYEDANTTREVKDFKMSEAGVLTWTECETYRSRITMEQEQMNDLEDAKEWLNFWKSCLRRAKRYWQMDSIQLDRIQEGEIKDEED
jgi:hypothetical protein